MTAISRIFASITPRGCITRNPAPIDNTIPAINDTKYGFVKDPTIEDRDEDGLLEYMAVFERDMVKEILEAGNNTLLISGEVENTYFEESDIVFAI